MLMGIDFDNTIVSYDGLMYRIGRERGLIAPDCPRSKKAIRDRIRELPDGEIEWQRVQGLAYGPRIAEAELIDGVREFVGRCREHGVAVHIVSHKTAYATYDPTHTNLREAALSWLENNAILSPQAGGLSVEMVHFAASRQEKLEWIDWLGCTHFIDDLEETFAEPAFPDDVERLLFSPAGERSRLPGVRSFRTWREITEEQFGSRA